jgi:hypothetical protein
MNENPWAAAVRLNDNKFSEMLNAQYEDRDRRLQAEGRTLKDIQPAIRDTWRPTKLDENGMRTESGAKHTLQIGQENPWAASAEPKLAASQQAASVSSGAPSEYGPPVRDMASASVLGAQAAAAQQARGSRFFPSRDARPETNREVRQETSAEAMRHSSPSPPPPDMAGHPAFDGDATHPHVSLPRPQPVVRLPPSAAKDVPATAAETTKASLGQSKSQGPDFAWASQPAYREHDHGARSQVQKPDNVWQAKIDNLLGGRKVHPPPRTTGADGGNRIPHQLAEPSPPSAPGSSVTTKGMAEECFEEQEMGSVPAVRLPKTIPEMAWQPSPPAKPLPKKLHAIVSSAEPITFPADVSGAGMVWRICLPGTESRNITVPFGRTRSNPRRGGQRGGRHGAPGPYRQGRVRETSASYSTEQGAGSGGSGSNPQHGRNHRGGYRGRDRENWSRSATNPVQT